MKAKILVYALPALILTTIHVAQAQQTKKVPLVGILFAATPSANSERIEAFRRGLRERGYVEGKDVLIQQRYADGNLDRLPALASDLMHLNVDVIVSASPLEPVP
jgi:putative tryptophan/tyrosine transport system substrate-binding protein